ncbi:MAG: hypothetical protein Q7U09_21450 [Hydrogenophaga sp.]|nr:hypothetical protein [Hydrogenophaga sp.]
MSSHPSDSVEVLLSDVMASGAGPGRPGGGGTSMVWNWVRGIGVALLTVVWAVMAHYTSTGNESSGWGAALALTPMSVALALGLWRLPSRWLGALAAAAVLAGLIGSWPFLKGQVALLYYVEHLGVYLLLSVFFGRTLKGPEESLVTQMARRVHGGVLSPAQAAYTRQVTLVWCIFFAGMALISTLLFLFAPVAAWSLFANLLGGPLIALMFVGEYLWRRHALPEEKRATMADAVRAWKAQRSDKAP